MNPEGEAASKDLEAPFTGILKCWYTEVNIPGILLRTKASPWKF
jgi:hypothetical protein